MKPKKLAVDLKTVFAAAQAYVMLSRVQAIEQLFILRALPKDKFYADGKALEELNRLNSISINSNPPLWENEKTSLIKIFSLNCQSLKSKFSHIQADKIITEGHIVCLSETWLLSDEDNEYIQLNGYILHANSAGRGKGLAIYFKPNMFQHDKDVNQTYFQLTKLKSKYVDVISVYRSKEGIINQILDQLSNLIDWDKTTLICGDFNVCYRSDRDNKLITTLEAHGFKQLVQEATHIKGGLIDHAYIRESGTSVSVDCSLYSPYYCAMDHDALLTTIDLGV